LLIVVKIHVLLGEWSFSYIHDEPFFFLLYFIMD